MAEPTTPRERVRGLFRTMFPEAFGATLERHGVATAATIDSDTLPDRISAEIASLGSVIVGRSPKSGYGPVEPRVIVHLFRNYRQLSTRDGATSPERQGE
jgi:hypothetical protein